MNVVLGIDPAAPDGDRTAFYARDTNTGVLGVGKSAREAEADCIRQNAELRRKGNDSNGEKPCE